MPANQLTITIAGSKDAELLATLSVATFCEAFAQDNKQEDMDKYIATEMNLNKLAGELADSRNVFFFIWHEDILAGYAKIRATTAPDELKGADPIEIERIYVLRKYHGYKAGAALMAQCIQYATEKGHDIVWLGVWEHNHKAINFYQRWGFEAFGKHGFLLGDDNQTDILMKKQL